MGLSRRTFIKGTAAATLLADLAFAKEAAAHTAKESARFSSEKRGFKHVKDDYSLDPSVLYLNHASIGTVPRVVQEAHIGYIKLCETNPWLYVWSDPWIEPQEVIRGKAAHLMGCDAQETVLTHNTTELFNLLAHGLPLGAGDEVLYSSLNHVSASTCWQNLAPKRGFSVRSFHFPIADCASLTFSEVVERYEAAIGPKTRVLVLPHIDNTVGIHHPLKEIATMAHEKGVQWVFVDGAQSAGMIPIDLHDSGIDAYSTSAHKWIQTPKGLGLTFLKKSLQADLDPMWVKHTYSVEKNGIHTYEDYSTRALPALIAMGDALDYQAQTDQSERQSHHVHLWSTMRQIVEASDRLIWKSPSQWAIGSAIYSVEVVGEQASNVAARLYQDHGIVVRPFTSDEINAIRISPNLMNDASDLETIAKAMLS